MEKYSKGEIAQIIIVSLAVVGGTFILAAAPGFAHIFKLFDAKTGRDKGRVKQSLNYLEKNNTIRIYDRVGRKVITLTNKGKQKVQQKKFDELKLTTQKKWDKIWRIVIFDIPENKRHVRLAVSFKLKQIGFYPLQKSVFIYPHECKKEIDFVRNFLDVKKCVRYILAHDIEDNHHLKEHFKIS